MTTIDPNAPVGVNWANSHTFRAQKLLSPTSVEELQDAVVSHERVRALGTRHSFNDIADTDGTLVSVARLPQRFDIDSAASTVTIAAGMRYADVATRLMEVGLALHNMGSLPHISVGGAVSTGTHGSGNGNRNLSSAVSAIEYVGANGELQQRDRSHPDFDGSVVALGALGVTTALTLDVQPAYEIRQDVFLDVPWSVILERYEEITASAFSVSIMPSWSGEVAGKVWLKSRAEDFDALPPDAFGGRLAGVLADGIPEGQKPNHTLQGGSVGPWALRLPHFRIDATPSAGDEIQTEYFIERSDAPAALTAVRELGDRIARHVHVSELRTVAADTQWLSPAYERDALALHLTWKNVPRVVERLLPVLEEALAPFTPRPHWGKWFAYGSGDIAEMYPRLAEFRELVERADPGGRFRNAYLERVIDLPR